MHYLRNIEIRIKTKIKQTCGLTEKEPVLHKYEVSGMYFIWHSIYEAGTKRKLSKKKDSDQELIQPQPTSIPNNKKGKKDTHKI